MNVGETRRVVIATERSAASRGWQVRLAVDGAILAEHFVDAYEDESGRWWPIPPEDVVRVDPGTSPPEPLICGLTAQVLTTGEVDAGSSREYGEYLFDLFLGARRWALADGGGVIELALAWEAGDGDLHRHLWELLTDAGAVLARDTGGRVCVIRQVAGRPSRPPVPVTEVPRMLFCVGTSLADPEIQAGAEIVGVLRGLQRDGAVIDNRIRLEQSLTAFRREFAAFRPHIVHIVAHGAWRAGPGHNTVQLRPEDGETDGSVTAGMLLDAMRDPELPRMVVLSSCETGASPQPGTPLRLGVSSFAAELVAAGVPIVVAMTGVVSDLACRLFARAFGTAIANGAPLARAAAAARSAAFAQHELRRPGTIDWALPAIFVAPDVPVGFAPVDSEIQRAIRTRLDKLEFYEQPVLCARDEFFEILDRLLEPTDRIAVLVVDSRTRLKRVGGSRLLRDLAAATLRAGHLPCVIGPFDDFAPRTVKRLALTIVRQLFATRAILGAPAAFRSETVARLWQETYREPLLVDDPHLEDAADELLDELGDDDPRIGRPPSVARWLRKDLLQSVRDVREAKVVPIRPDASPVLFLDDVDRYGGIARSLGSMLGTSGLSGSDDRPRELLKIPVVLFGRVPAAANSVELTDFAQSYDVKRWVRQETLRTFPDLARFRDSDDDLLAWQCLLLHPDPDGDGPRKVFTPRRGAESAWHDTARTLLGQSASVYDGPALRTLATVGLQAGWFHEDDDDAILAAYGRDWRSRP